MKTYLFVHLSLISFSLWGQSTSLTDLSQMINKDLPQVYDRMTKLQRTTVENDRIIYHFLVDANQKEFDGAVSKVKTQILSSICGKKYERMILLKHKADIVYRYENLKGQSLGEFMVRPDHCSSHQ